MSKRVPVRMVGGRVRYLNRRDMTRIQELEHEPPQPQTDASVGKNLPQDELSEMIAGLKVAPKQKKGRGKMAYV